MHTCKDKYDVKVMCVKHWEQERRKGMTSEEVCLDYLKTKVYVRSAAFASYILETGWYDVLNPGVVDVLLEFAGEVEHDCEYSISKKDWNCLIHAAAIGQGLEVGCLCCLVRNYNDVVTDFVLYRDNR
jgi:hypothetical protein